MDIKEEQYDESEDRMVHLFIDTNTLLGFYDYSNDDLDELKKLEVLIAKDELRVYVSEQLLDEFYRNRETKFLTAFSRFEKDQHSQSFPQLCKQYKEYTRMREVLGEYLDLRKSMIAQIYKDFETVKLKADRAIIELIQKGHRMAITPDTLRGARDRRDRGNPPGKKSDALGDEIHWESLLKNVAKGTTLHLVSIDGDFQGKHKIDNVAKLNPFLEFEWKTKNGGDVFYFPTLSAFTKAKFPQINLRAEVEKDEAVKALANVRTHDEGRIALCRLERFETFSRSQLQAILYAAVRSKIFLELSSEPFVNREMRRMLDSKSSVDIDADAYWVYYREYVCKEVNPLD